MLTIPSVLEAGGIEELRREELEEARAIQSVMLPADVLGQVTVAYEFQPVDTVGGDFLDYFQLPDSSVGVYVGDVSGKGLPAAMYAALAVGILRSIHKTGQSPASVLSVLNRRLTSRGGLRRHAAILYGLFDPDTSEMSLASAGMPARCISRQRAAASSSCPAFPRVCFPAPSTKPCRSHWSPATPSCAAPMASLKPRTPAMKTSASSA